MSDRQPADEASPAGGFAARWREVLAAIDDRILRACLPKDHQAIFLTEDRLTIAVDSEFKKEYCRRKQAKLEETIARVIGPRRLVIGEPPLVESVREVRPQVETAGRIGVLGIGDGGVNAIDRMREEHLQGVRLIAVDTDKQVLGMSRVHEILQLGLDITGGRGTGGDETKGRQAAQESRWEIASLLKGMDLVFITAGLGGGTGTGAAPVVAEIAKESGALTIGVVTKPFSFEGTVRRARAEAGLAKLRQVADVLIVVSNDRLLETAAKGLALTKAFELADGILHQGVRGISDLITVRGLVNLDFSDIRTLLVGAGEAMMGMGEARGEGRAVAAAKLASANPLLEGGSVRGAKKLIMNITGGEDLTLSEVTAAADLVRRVAATECDLVFGAVVKEGFKNGVKITVIAADFQESSEEESRRKELPRRERIKLTKELDVPTFLRRSREAPGEEKAAK
jgi:cell division protein FtsZ